MLHLLLELDVLVFDLLVLVVQLLHKLLFLLILGSLLIPDLLFLELEFVFELAFVAVDPILDHLHLFPKFLLLPPQHCDFSLVELLHAMHRVQQIGDLLVLGVAERVELLLLLVEEQLRLLFLVCLSDQSLRSQLHLGGETGDLLLVLEVERGQLDLEVLHSGFLFGDLDLEVLPDLVVVLQSLVQLLLVGFVDVLQRVDFRLQEGHLVLEI